MPTNFPTGSDVFNTPNNPGSTALSAAGTAARNHVQHHRDLGDAIVAMQVEATLAIHSHDGATARHGNKLLQVNTHGSPDTDSGPTAIHHTLGHLANQAAPGNHASLPAFQDTHAASVSWPVGSIYINTTSTNPNTLLGFGTWSQIQDAFLIGASATYTYTGSVVNNSSTHVHTVADTDAQGSHTHTYATPTDSQFVHGHTSGSSGGTNIYHTHDGSGDGYDTSYAPSADSTSSGTSDGQSSGHSHGNPNSEDYNAVSGGADYLHTHSISTYDNAAAHSHTVTGTTSGSTHSHSVTVGSTAHLPTWKALYMWKRTA